MRSPVILVVLSLVAGCYGQVDCSTKPDNTTCLADKSCKWNTQACVNKSIAADCSASANTIQQCISDYECDWYSDKCLDYRCFYRFERDCLLKRGCSWYPASKQCSRSKSAECSNLGTIECLVAAGCGINTTTSTNKCVSCSSLSEDDCLNTDLCRFNSTHCVKQPSCSLHSKKGCDPAEGCHVFNDLCVDVFDLPCKDTKRCQSAPVTGCDSSCDDLQINVEDCPSLPIEDCNHYINCSYSDRQQLCVASDRCSNETICDTVKGCVQLYPGTCIRYSEAPDFCSLQNTSSSCVVDDRCTWLNDSCHLMIGCATDNQELCESKQTCQWSSGCQRVGTTCNTINLNTACDNGPCSGVNPVYKSGVLIGGKWVDGAFPPEFQPPSYTSNSITALTLEQKGIACVGTDCLLCQSGYIMTDKAVIECKQDGGMATIRSTGGTGGTTLLCVPAYFDDTAVPTAIPTAIPTAVPTAIPTMVPTFVPTLVPTAVPTAEPTLSPTPVPTSVEPLFLPPPTTPPTLAPTLVPTPIPTGIPPTPAQKAYEEQEQTASIATSAAAISGALPAAGAVIAATIPCNIHDSGKLPFPLHPTGLVIDGSISAGAIIGNNLIVGLFCLVMRLVLLLFTSGIIPKSVVPSGFFDGFLDTQGMLRFPSAPLFVYQGLYQGTFLAALLLIQAPPGHNAVLWVIVSVVAIISCIGVPVAVFYETRTGVPMDAIYYKDYFEDSKLKTYLLGKGEWVSVERNTHWINRYASIARAYKQKYVYFSMVHFAMSALIAVVQSVSASGGACAAIKLVSAVLFFSVAVVCIVLRPYARMVDNHIIAITFIVQTVSLVLSAAYFLNRDSDSLLNAASTLNYVVLSLLLLKVLLSFVIEVYVFVVKRRVRLQSNHWIKKMAVLDTIQPSHLGYGGSTDDEPMMMLAQKFSFSQKLSTVPSGSCNSLLAQRYPSPGDSPKGVRSEKSNSNPEDTSHLLL